MISWLTNLGKILYPQTMKTIWVIERSRLKLLKFELTQGPKLQRISWDLAGYWIWRRDHANKHYHSAWYTNFDADPLKKIQVTEQTRFILAIFANSRAITPKCLIGSGWLLHLAKRLCQQTVSQSLMMLHWKIFQLQSGHGLFWQIRLIQGQ